MIHAPSAGRFVGVLAVTALAAGLTACAGTPSQSASASRSPHSTSPGYGGSTSSAVPRAQAYIAKQPAALRPYFEQLYAAGDRNAVLNFNRLGVAALANHEYDIAKKKHLTNPSRVLTRSAPMVLTLRRP